MKLFNQSKLFLNALGFSLRNHQRSVGGDNHVEGRCKQVECLVMSRCQDKTGLSKQKKNKIQGKQGIVKK